MSMGQNSATPPNIQLSSLLNIKSNPTILTFKFRVFGIFSSHPKNLQTQLAWFFLSSIPPKNQSLLPQKHPKTTPFSLPIPSHPSLTRKASPPRRTRRAASATAALRGRSCSAAGSPATRRRRRRRRLGGGSVSGDLGH